MHCPIIAVGGLDTKVDVQHSGNIAAVASVVRCEDAEGDRWRRGK